MEQNAYPLTLDGDEKRIRHPEILDWFDRRTFGPSNLDPFRPDAGLLAELKRKAVSG